MNEPPHPMAQRDFNDTYLEMHDRIYRLAAQITGSRQDAEDIVQDLYEKLWRKRLVVMTRSNPKGYILTGARNLCLDRMRSTKRSVELSPAMSAGDREYETDVREIVEGLMAALPEKQRTVMHLRDVECMEITEIAAVMGTGETAVRMSLSRARTTVKERLIEIMSYGIRRR